MLGVVPIPYMDTAGRPPDARGRGRHGHGQHVQQGAGRRLLRHARASRSTIPTSAAKGPRRRGCISCGNCMIGCGHNAKNKLTVNYLYLAEKHGAEIHELHEVHELKPLRRRRLRGACPPPGLDAARGRPAPPRTPPQQVIVSAHAYGSAKLLHRMKHTGTLPGLSDQLGKRARTNSEQLHRRSRGPTASGSTTRSGSTSRPARWPSPRACGPTTETSIEPVYYGVGSDLMTFAAHLPPARRAEAPGARAGSRRWSSTRRRCSASSTRATGPSAGGAAVHADLRHLDRAVLEGRHAAQPPRQRRRRRPRTSRWWRTSPTGWRRRCTASRRRCGPRCVNRTASAHFIGGITIGERADQGVVDPVPARVRLPGAARDGRQRDAGQPGREPVADDHRAGRARDVVLAATRATPIRRAALGSGYQRIKAVMPHQPIVPEGRAGRAAAGRERRTRSSRCTRTDGDRAPIEENRHERCTTTTEFRALDDAGKLPRQLRQPVLPRRPEAPRVGGARRRQALRLRRPVHARGCPLSAGC